MISYLVTNHDERNRSWQVEPYGDVITLKPGDTMTVEYEHASDLIIEVFLYSGQHEELWVQGATRAEALLPEDLKHNGVTVWPQVER